MDAANTAAARLSLRKQAASQKATSLPTPTFQSFSRNFWEMCVLLKFEIILSSFAKGGKSPFKKKTCLFLLASGLWSPPSLPRCFCYGSPGRQLVDL